MFAYLESEWAAWWVLRGLHHRHVAPLHGQPVGQGEDGDGRTVGSTRIKLKLKKKIDIVLMQKST